MRTSLSGDSLEYIPLFIVNDRTIVEESHGLQTACVRVRDNPAGRGENVFQAARETADCLLIDPSTDYLEFPANEELIATTDVPYWSVTTPEDLSSPNARLEFVKNVLTYQDQLGADVLIAPYFYARELSGQSLTTTIRMMVQAAQLASEFQDKPVAGMLSIDGSIVIDDAAPSALSMALSIAEIDIILLKVVNLSDDAPQDMVTPYLKLVQVLSQSFTVIGHMIGSLGIAALGAGATGFCCGLQWLDVQRPEQLRTPARGYGAGQRRRGWVYLPEVLQSVPEEAIARVRNRSWLDEDGEPTERMFGIPYECDEFPPEGDIAKNSHYLRERLKEVEGLSQAETARQGAIGLLEEASNIAHAIDDPTTFIDPEPVDRWITGLQSL